MFRRKNRVVSSSEPTWLTDYTDPRLRDHERRIASGLHDGLGNGEHILAEGRTILVDAADQSEAYVGVTNQRLLCVLLDTRRPSQGPVLFECPLGSVVAVTVDDEGVALLVRVRGRVSEGESVFALHTATQEPELRSAILGVAGRSP
jgi:hypothetical protein